MLRAEFFSILVESEISPANRQLHSLPPSLVSFTIQQQIKHDSHQEL